MLAIFAETVLPWGSGMIPTRRPMMRRTAPLALSSLLLIALAACGTERYDTSNVAPRAGPWSASYSCADGGTLKVRFESDHVVIRTGDGEQLILPLQTSDSVRLYATNRHSLQQSGDQAIWAVGSGRPVACKA
ncbi:hypothetical protein ACFQ4K_30980 [Tistrella bauzanensis]